MKKNNIKLLAASVILAGHIVLLPGCYKALDFEEQDDIKINVLDELNALSFGDDSYIHQKRVEKLYAKINKDSVKVKQVLGKTDSNSYAFYTTGCDIMVILQGEKPMVWFSSNITPSDAYSAIASYNENELLMDSESFNYLNPRDFEYFAGDTIDGIDINYSDGGKLDINANDGVREIIVCAVTPSMVKGLDDKQTEEYILKQEVNYDIPNYAFMTLNHSEEMPILYMKDSVTLGVFYGGNDYETYIGFAEEDFCSIPFFRFKFKEIDSKNIVLYKA